MVSPLLALPGAVEADPPDAGVAAHYGEPFHEQRRLAEQAAVVDRSNRGVLSVRGVDRLSWLHSLTTQHLEHLPAGQAVEGLFLDAHGRVEHHFVAYDDGETTWLDVEAASTAPLLEYLQKMVFMLRVEPADVTADWAVLTLGGPQRPPLPEGVQARELPWGTDLLVPRERLRAVVDDLGVPVAGMDAFEALRVAAHRPRLGRDTDHRTIPHELGWLESAVHLEKGCYRGQETVARVHNLGRPPRRLVFLHLDGTEVHLPSTGAPVEVDGRQVGYVGTAVRHYELGPIALAVVKRNTDDAAPMTAGGIPASAERVVDA